MTFITLSNVKILESLVLNFCINFDSFKGLLDIIHNFTPRTFLVKLWSFMFVKIRLQNNAACIIFSQPKYTHVSPLPITLVTSQTTHQLQNICEHAAQSTLNILPQYITDSLNLTHLGGVASAPAII